MRHDRRLLAWFVSLCVAPTARAGEIWTWTHEGAGQGTANVFALYGGFEGTTEVPGVFDLNNRDFVANETIPDGL